MFQGVGAFTNFHNYDPSSQSCTAQCEPPYGYKADKQQHCVLNYFRWGTIGRCGASAAALAESAQQATPFRRQRRWTADDACDSTAVLACHASSQNRTGLRASTCVTCAEHCLHCENSASCTNASAGFFLNNGVPSPCVEVVDCAPGTKSMTASEMCLAGNALTSQPGGTTACKPCANRASPAGCSVRCAVGCSACDNSTACTHAEAGFFLNRGEPENCAAITNCPAGTESMASAEMCASGNTLPAQPNNATGCKPCANAASSAGCGDPCGEGCLRCANATFCTSPNAGHFISSGVPGACVEITGCPAGTRTMTAAEMCTANNALTAQPGSASACKPCSNSASPAGCSMGCAVGCRACDDATCAEAEAGYFLNGRMPAPCEEVLDCATGTTSLTAADMCPEGNQLRAQPTSESGGCHSCLDAALTSAGLPSRTPTQPHRGCAMIHCLVRLLAFSKARAFVRLALNRIWRAITRLVLAVGFSFRRFGHHNQRAGGRLWCRVADFRNRVQDNRR